MDVSGLIGEVMRRQDIRAGAEWMLATSELMSWAEQTSRRSFEEAGEGDRNTVR